MQICETPTTAEGARGRRRRYTDRMRLQGAAVSGAILIGLTFAVPSGAGAGPPIAMPTTSVAPVVDGKVLATEWSGAAIGRGFRVSGSTRLAREFTEVRVMSDGEFLYVAFVCGDSQAWRIVAKQRPSLAAFRADDHVTVEVAADDPALARRSFSVNAIGVQLAPAVGERDWRTATAHGDFGWSAEMAIPVAALGLDPIRLDGAVEFLRHHNRTRETSQWSGADIEAPPAVELPRLVEPPALTVRPLDPTPASSTVPPMPSAPPEPTTRPSVPPMPALGSVPPMPDPVEPPLQSHEIE